MDLNQRKLNKDEWNGIEIPVNEREKMVLNLISQGYHDVQIKTNNNLSLIDFLKIPFDQSIVDYLYETYMVPKLKSSCKKNSLELYRITKNNNKMKKADTIRVQNAEKGLVDNEDKIFEFKLIDLFTSMLSYINKGSKKWITRFYTLKILMSYSVRNVNEHLTQFIAKILNGCASNVTKLGLIKNGYDMIEKNQDLLKYADEELYEHQKQLFTVAKRPNAKLILYIAPTGTGKTMSPVGLSEGYKVIFVCAARHVGLALAKNAISIGKKIAFAFGCNAAEDIRLHYFAAKEYTLNRKSGQIFKVDNTIGDKVEIMISDIKSYIPAMLYMLAFNPAEKIILYWDEPTITLDYETHDLHFIIQRNWSENLIPNIVLSSATLPQENEIRDTIVDFKSKFMSGNPEIHTIVSHDCKKTIPIINKEGFVEMPHYLYENYNDIKEVVKHCDKFKTIMRYIDLEEAIHFIAYINEKNLFVGETDGVEHSRNFDTIESVNMKNIKLYYLKLLKRISPEHWGTIYSHFQERRKRKHESNIHVTTQDAHTLTDGPTIFLADDTTKIGNFCIQTAKIPANVIREITEAIVYNNTINARIDSLQKDLEDGIAKDEGKEKKMADARVDPEMKRLMQKIEEMRSMVKTVALNEMFVPNTRAHLGRFNAADEKHAFTCDISEQVVEKIMQIHGIDDSWKLLLMMGIGVFANQDNAAYVEIMKKLAQEQKLYMIIASTDYIYGTNYQFCHGYISKDLGGMSQEKCIQAMGRVGRNNLQASYSLRFRDNELIYKLFREAENRPEVDNMNRLFQTSSNDDDE
jgi:hypothetical protein